jgi:hypothetical protein
MNSPRPDPPLPLTILKLISYEITPENVTNLARLLLHATLMVEAVVFHGGSLVTCHLSLVTAT